MLKLLPAPVRKLAEDARDLHRRVQIGGFKLANLSQPTISPEALPFLDPIDQICEEPPPRLMRSVAYIVMGMFAALVLVASFTKVNVVVVGGGRITTDKPPMMIQTIERSIVRELNVKAGDTVTKGQVIATLDPTFTQADLQSLTTQQQSLQAQARRLEAELNGTPFEVGPTPTANDLLQQTLYSQRQAHYAAQIEVFDQDIARRKAAIASTEDDRTSQIKQLAVAKEVEGMRGSLLQKEFGSKLNFLEAQASRMRIEQNVQQAANKLTELQHDLQSKEAERQAFVNQWRDQILDNLVTTRNELAKAGEGMAKASLLNNLVVLRAPEDGVVLDVAKRSVGSVMREAEPLVTIIQSNATLIADVTINSSDVGYIKTGDPVVVKVDAFPYQRHGWLEGRLASISEESFPAGGGSEDQVGTPVARANGGAYHRGRVEFTATSLANLPEGARLIPGMTVTAEVMVGARSVMSYLLNPLTRVLHESIREP